METLAQTIHLTNNANSPTDSTASLVTKGGAAVTKDVRVGGIITFSSIQTNAAAYQMTGSSLSLSSTDNYYMIEVTFSGAAGITLPLASVCPGKQYFIVKLSSNANSLTISRSGADTIDGIASDITVLTEPYDRVRLISNGNATWYTC